MTDYKQIFRYVFIVIAVLLVIGLEVTTARGGHGGGGMGRGGGSAGRGGGGGSRGGRWGGHRGLGYSGGSGSSAGWNGSPDIVTPLVVGGSLMVIIFGIALTICCKNCREAQKMSEDTALRAQPRTSPVEFVGTDVGLQLVRPTQN